MADQIADKLSATMSTAYPQGRASSRVKDLVDLVIIARTQHVDLDQLCAAIATKQGLGHLPRLGEFSIPAAWERQYPALAANTPAVDGVTNTGAATKLVAELVNPALAGASASPATWVPGVGWLDPQGAAEHAQADPDPRTGVQVRADYRASGPAQEHHRAPRGTADTQPEGQA